MKVVEGVNIDPRGVCDFCSPPAKGRYVYKARPYEIMEPVGSRLPHFTSTGAWLACETCSELIEAQDKVAIVERGLVDLPGFKRLREIVINEFFIQRFDERIDTLCP